MGIVIALAFVLPGAATTAARHAGWNGELDVAHSGGDYAPLDPALANTNDVWQVLYSTCLKLVNWPDANGAAGQKLVPDGAAMPAVSDHGRTYTFTIRPGQRFSDGTPVMAANFKAEIDRVSDPKMGSNGATWIDDVIGVDAALQGKATGVSGVTASGMTLTIHVKHIDPTLLERLAMPFFCAIPTSTPHDPGGDPTAPSAGPYYIANDTPGHGIVLEQNPYYTGSRPRQASKIVIQTGQDGQAAYEQVQVGQIALDVNGPPYNFWNELGHQYGVNKGRFFVEPALWTGFAAFNTTRPDVSNANIRKAINYAIPRSFLVSLGGRYGGTAASQLLPSALTGGPIKNPYPLVPNLKKARSLLPHGKCGRIVAWVSPGPQPGWLLLKSEFAKIGCDLVLDPVPGDILSAAGVKGATYDIVIENWFVDYPDPYDVLYHLLDGNTITPKGNFNLAYLNNRTLNKQIEKANLLPLGKARLQAFAKIDYDAMRNLAPVLVVSHGNSITFLAPNIAGFTYSPFGPVGVDLDTLYQK